MLTSVEVSQIGAIDLGAPVEVDVRAQWIEEPALVLLEGENLLMSRPESCSVCIPISRRVETDSLSSCLPYPDLLVVGIVVSISWGKMARIATSSDASAIMSSAS